MKKFNEIILNITVAILDFLYRGRDYQRFWVLEEIARAPYFAFLSVLHFRESMGLRGPEHLYLMKQHFEQSVNASGVYGKQGWQYLFYRSFCCQASRPYLLLD